MGDESFSLNVNVACVPVSTPSPRRSEKLVRLLVSDVGSLWSCTGEPQTRHGTPGVGAGQTGRRITSFVLIQLGCCWPLRPGHAADSW